MPREDLLIVAHVSLPIIRRRLFTITSAISFVLCLATIVLWVRSHWRVDQLTRIDLDVEAYRRYDVRSEIGWILTVRERFDLPGPKAEVHEWQYFGGAPLDHSRLWYYRSPELRVQVAVGFPHWILALLFACLPAWWLTSLVRSRSRNRAGLCPSCGYDLRATPDRCPECGRLATESQERSAESRNLATDGARIHTDQNVDGNAHVQDSCRPALGEPRGPV
jgi:hypothetical protein